MENPLESNTVVGASKKALYEVTAVSKILSAVVCIVLPFVGFWLGVLYEDEPAVSVPLSVEGVLGKSVSEENVREAPVTLQDLPEGTTIPDCGASCVWKMLESEDLGIRLYVRKVENAAYFVKGNILYIRLSDGQGGFDWVPVLEVFKKMTDWTIEHAIARVASDKGVPEVIAYGGCRIVKTDKYELGLEKEVYEYIPVGKYATFIDEFYTDDEKPSLDYCGQFSGETLPLFEYHPKESRTRFLFIYAGWDYPNEAFFYPSSISFK